MIVNINSKGEMKIKDIKSKMLKWSDYYGGDIMQRDKIEKAKTKLEPFNIMNGHIRFLELQNIDAINHAENFKKDLFEE